jgi:hypothetical protein
VKNFDPMAEMARMLSRVAPATVAPPVVRPTRPDQASEPTVTQSSRLATISAHSTIFQNFYYRARVPLRALARQGSITPATVWCENDGEHRKPPADGDLAAFYHPIDSQVLRHIQDLKRRGVRVIVHEDVCRQEQPLFQAFGTDNDLACSGTAGVLDRVISAWYSQRDEIRTALMDGTLSQLAGHDGLRMFTPFPAEQKWDLRRRSIRHQHHGEPSGRELPTNWTCSCPDRRARGVLVRLPLQLDSVGRSRRELLHRLHEGGIGGVGAREAPTLLPRLGLTGGGGVAPATDCDADILVVPCLARPEITVPTDDRHRLVGWGDRE